METRIITFDGSEVKASIVIEASPTPGAAGLIAGNFLIESLEAKKVAEVVSPFFPQISLINDQGIASRPKIEIYLADVQGRKILLMSRNFPVESNEGSHILARKLYEFLAERGVVEYYVFASGRITGERGVYVSSTSIDEVKSFLAAGARLSPSLESLPVDKLTGFLMMFFAREKKRVFLLLSDTPSYFPDPLAARRLLEVFSRGTQLQLDLSKLDAEIEKQRRVMEEVEQGALGLAGEREEKSPREPFYIG